MKPGGGSRASSSACGYGCIRSFVFRSVLFFFGLWPFDFLPMRGSAQSVPPERAGRGYGCVANNLGTT